MGLKPKQATDCHSTKLEHRKPEAQSLSVQYEQYEILLGHPCVILRNMINTLSLWLILPRFAKSLRTLRTVWVGFANCHDAWTLRTRRVGLPQPCIGACLPLKGACLPLKGARLIRLPGRGPPCSSPKRARIGLAGGSIMFHPIWFTKMWMMMLDDVGWGRISSNEVMYFSRSSPLFLLSHRSQLFEIQLLQ